MSFITTYKLHTTMEELIPGNSVTLILSIHYYYYSLIYNPSEEKL